MASIFAHNFEFHSLPSGHGHFKVEQHYKRYYVTAIINDMDIYDRCFNGSPRILDLRELSRLVNLVGSRKYYNR